MSLRSLPITGLSIRGERAMRTVPLYAVLKRMLIADGYAFRVPALNAAPSNPDRVLFLNLTYWGAGEASDVLASPHLDADVLTHAAWHHAARKALAPEGPPTAAALFLGEAVASAFDLYLVGRHLQGSGRGDFLATQVPAMSAAASEAGMGDEALAALFEGIAGDPERAFEDLRALLFDAASALLVAPDLDHAVAALDHYSTHRFGSLLHHYALSAWVLYARAYAGPAVANDPAHAIDADLRLASSSLEWLEARWLA